MAPAKTHSNLARYRLYNQNISRAAFDNPGDVVGWLGAVQAQDYLGALWAIGLRTKKATEESIEKAIAAKSIVRTWPLRGTLHFVAPADVRWMLRLSTPRVVAASAGRQRQLGLDDAVFARSKELFEEALQGGKQLPRGEMYALLEAAQIPTAGGRGLHILWRLAHDGVICFGARKGKQQTITLLDEWVPAAKTLGREEALSELARRYFTSHGPATLQDFMWWSSLTMADARAGVEAAKVHLARDIVEGQTYWLARSMPNGKDPPPNVFLLPAFDEYTVSYKDRSAVLDPLYAKRVNSRNGIFSSAIVVDGQIVGTWKRILKKDSVVISPTLFTSLNKAEKRALAAAAHQYGEFLGLPAVLA